MNDNHTDAQGELTAADAIHMLRLALVNAECAIKGREHTGFITKALEATSRDWRATEGQAQASAATLEAIDKILRGNVCDPDPLKPMLPGAVSVSTTYGLVAGLFREVQKLRAQLADSTAPAAPTAQSLTSGGAHDEHADLIGFLEDLRPSYSDIGSRDVDTTAKNLTIDRAIAKLRAAAPLPQVQSEALEPIGDDERFKDLLLAWHMEYRERAFSVMVERFKSFTDLTAYIDNRAADQRPVTEAKRETPSGALADNDVGVA